MRNPLVSFLLPLSLLGCTKQSEAVTLFSGIMILAIILTNTFIGNGQEKAKCLPSQNPRRRKSKFLLKKRYE